MNLKVSALRSAREAPHTQRPPEDVDQDLKLSVRSVRHRRPRCDEPRRRATTRYSAAPTPNRQTTMTTTVRDDAAIEFEPRADAPVWSLVIAHHGEAALLGVRRVILRDAALDLGRTCGAFGEGALSDPQVSRVHARVEVDASGALTVSDLGSANGTWVDNERVASTPLREGSVLRVGPVLFVAQRAPETYPLRRSERCPAIAWPTVDFASRLRAALSRRSIVAVTGACPAAWRQHLSRVAEDLRLTVRDQPSLAAARARSPSELCVVAPTSLDGRDAASRRDDVAHAAALVLVGSAQTSEVTTLAMPPLVERIEDIPWLVRGALTRALGRVPAMDAGFVARLLLGAWPEDLDGLERWADAVARRPERHERLVWQGEDLSFTGGPRRVASLAPTIGAVDGAAHVALDGSWFRVGAEDVVDLRTRFALARVLRALARLRESAPESALSIDMIAEVGWPGEKLVSDSSANRVYVAIATLRRLGLRSLLERREGGIGSRPP